MGEKIELAVEARMLQGKAVKKLRKDGFTPAVVYGQDFEAQSVMAPEMVMAKAYRIAGKHHPVELLVGDKKRLAMIKSADIDPVKHKLRHVAFHVVKQNEKVTTEVPIAIEGTGETAAEKAGLVVLTTVEMVELEALPRDLPDNLVAPGERLVEVNDHLTIADLKVPNGVTVLSEPEQVIATVYEPSALQAANEAAGGEEEVAEGVEAEHDEEAGQEPQDDEGQSGSKSNRSQE